MRKVRFSESAIIGIIREQEAGAKVADLCRRHGISVPTLYNWKAKYGGWTCRRKRLRALEDENRRLKTLLAEQVLDNAALRDLGGEDLAPFAERLVGRDQHRFPWNLFGRKEFHLSYTVGLLAWACEA